MSKLPAAVIALLGAAVIALVVVLVTRHDAARASAAPRVITAHKLLHAPKRYLYSLDGHSGTLIPTGVKGQFRLTVAGVHPSALYFLDRPNAQVGTMTIPELLGVLFGKPGQAPPNAAVNALVPQVGDHQLTMGVTLLSATYDHVHQSVHFLVHSLPQGPSSRREHGRTDVTLPRTFSHTSLYIDDGGNTCRGEVSNLLSVDLPLSTSGKWSTDDWNESPGSVSANGTMNYESDGGEFRGCHNWVTFATPDGGTIQLSMTDPHSGSNTIDCDNATYGTSEFKCGYYGFSTIGGDYIVLEWVICSNNPDYQENVSPGDGNTYGGCDWLDQGDGAGGSGGITWVG